MNRIKELRKKRKLTLKQVSEDTNIPISTLSSYEKGDRQPKIDKIISLANYFDVPVSYLTGLYNTNKLDELLKQKNISKKQISEDLHIPLVKIVDYASNRKEIPVVDGIKISS